MHLNISIFIHSLCLPFLVLFISRVFCILLFFFLRRFKFGIQSFLSANHLNQNFISPVLQHYRYLAFYCTHYAGKLQISARGYGFVCCAKNHHQLNLSVSVLMLIINITETDTQIIYFRLDGILAQDLSVAPNSS